MQLQRPVCTAFVCHCAMPRIKGDIHIGEHNIGRPNRFTAAPAPVRLHHRQHSAPCTPLFSSIGLLRESKSRMFALSCPVHCKIVFRSWLTCRLANGFLMAAHNTCHSACSTCRLAHITAPVIIISDMTCHLSKWPRTTADSYCPRALCCSQCDVVLASSSRRCPSTGLCGQWLVTPTRYQIEAHSKLSNSNLSNGHYL